MRDIIIVGYMKNNNIYIYYKTMDKESIESIGPGSPKSVILEENIPSGESEQLELLKSITYDPNKKTEFLMNLCQALFTPDEYVKIANPVTITRFLNKAGRINNIIDDGDMHVILYNLSKSINISSQETIKQLNRILGIATDFGELDENKKVIHDKISEIIGLKQGIMPFVTGGKKTRKRHKMSKRKTKRNKKSKRNRKRKKMFTNKRKKRFSNKKKKTKKKIY